MMLGEVVLTAIAWLFAVLTAAIVIFLAAVWFGLYVVAPRIGRALDRAESDDPDADDPIDRIEEPGDRPA